MAYPKGHQQAGVKRAVHVFNPIGYGGVASTVMWSILVGCTDYTTAARRAGALLPEGDTAEGERWDTDGRTFLAVVLYAAAVGERNVQNVIRWIRLAGQDKTRDAANHELTEILDRDPDNAEKIGLLQQFMSINEKTRSSMTSTLTKALAWVSDNTARRIGAAPLEEVNLDVRQLILADETLHIVGPSTTGGMMQALTSALVDEFAYQARMLAGEMPGERLDPPVVMALDEAAVTVELPLPAWSADYGGRGIHLQIAVQSLAQLTDRWNKAGAATLRGNIGTLILYGGGVDADELEQISKLCGFHRRLVVGGAGEDTDHDGEVWERVPVLSVDDLSNLPQGQAAVLKRGLGGVVQARIPTVLNYGIRKLPLPGMAPIPAPTRRRGRPEAVEVDPAVLLPGLATGNAGEVVA
jgi:type IV secretory pathway TraG/TraD family ATPase VirD4